MKLSAKGQYGLQALTFLAQKGLNEPIPISTIAKTKNIPTQFLEQIFVELRKNDFVKSVRGVKGGYILNREPHVISVGEVVRVLEGPIQLVDCLDETGDKNICCQQNQHCVTKKVWEKVRDSMYIVLDNITISDLAKGNVDFNF